MIDVSCNEVEEGEIEGEIAPQQQPSESPAGAPGWGDDQELDLDVDIKKRKPKKEKKKKNSIEVVQQLANRQPSAAAADGSTGQQYYDVYGQDAHASVEIRTDSPIRLNDVQGLVLWTLAEAVNPRWAFVKNKPLIKHLVLVVAHGLSAELYKQKQELLPNLQKLGKPTVVIAQSAHSRTAQTAGALLNTSVRKRKQQEANGSKRGAGAGPEPSTAPPFPPSHYCLSCKDMETVNYPMAVKDEASGAMRLPEGFLSTLPAAAAVAEGSDDAAPPPPPPPPEASTSAPAGEASPEQLRGGKRRKTAAGTGPAASSPPSTQPGREVGGGGGTGAGAHAPSSSSLSLERMVALDCEMCITASGFELTRISMVDAEGRVLMDELVLPHNPITDYNTRYSGITEEMLSKVTTRLEDVQKRFMKLVTAETLLVGHSLENDLKALRLVHDRVLDTALMFPHPKGPPFRSALKVLALRFLKRKIQDGSHDSIVDARTAMDLVNLKIKHGPSYGTPEFESPNVRKLVDVLGQEHRHRCCLVDRHDALKRFATGSAAAIPVTQDHEAVEHLAREAGLHKYAFLWTQLLDLNNLLTKRAQHRHAEYLAKNRKEGQGPAAAAAAAAVGIAEAGPTDLETETEPELDVLGHEGAKQAAQGEPEAAATAAAEGEGEEFLTEAALDAALQRLDAQVGKLYASLPSNTLLMVATGQGDTAECRCRQEVKCKRMARVDGLPEWTLQDEEAYKQVLDREIQALCFCCVKQ